MTDPKVDPQDLLNRVVENASAIIAAENDRRHMAAERRLKARDERSARVGVAVASIAANLRLTDTERKEAVKAAKKAADDDLTVAEKAIDSWVNAEKIEQERAAAAKRLKAVAEGKKNARGTPRPNMAAPKTIIDPSTRGPLTGDIVHGWWEFSSRRRPLPDAGACARLAAAVEMCLAAPGAADRQSAPTPLNDARSLLMNHFREGMERLAQKAASGNIDAHVKVERFEAAHRALLHVARDWLEDQCAVVDLEWEAHARFIYGKAVREWVNAGHKVAKPSAKSPPVVFVSWALAYLGVLKTPNAIRWLLDGAEPGGGRRKRTIKKKGEAPSDR